MADHEEDEQLKKEFHSWSLKDDRKVCDDMAHNKEKLVERVKDTEDKLNKVSSHVEELSSYVEKLNAMISRTSQAKFLQEDIAEEKLQQAPVEEKVSSSEHVVETMETLRKAIQVGLSTVELFSKEIESVSMMPELIGVFPPLSDAQEPSTRTPVCDMAKQIHTGVNEPVAAVPGEKLMTDFDNSEVKHDTEDDSCDQRYDVKSVEYPSFEGPPLVSSAPDTHWPGPILFSSEPPLFDTNRSVVLLTPTTDSSDFERSLPNIPVKKLPKNCSGDVKEQSLKDGSTTSPKVEDVCKQKMVISKDTALKETTPVDKEKTEKVMPKKLIESPFSKLLGEKLARGPVQPAESKQADTSSSKATVSGIVATVASPKAKKDSDETHNSDFFKPLYSVVKDRTRGPTRRPPSKNKVGSGILPPEIGDAHNSPAEDVVPKLEKAEVVVAENEKLPTESKENPHASIKQEKTTHAECAQRSAVQSLFDADSDEGEDGDNLFSNAVAQNLKCSASSDVEHVSSSKPSSKVTTHSLFSDDDDSDLSLFRKK
ncbi:hypothetical protein NECAME_03223 [Necator americanus]|uniref:Uncharacterized protein n=1 Tax=Necator americanus TaxID=51031 RepID=W2T8M0_NECAM|nr:hypothetical protein NECAME_03223 [Necator americanus]ETN77322.1 hypothetical protein NECAME_03223 [Necator americanus]